MALRGTRIQPATAADNTRLPKKGAKATPNFRMATNPRRWNWNPLTGEWLPALAHLPWVPGVNGGVSTRAGFDDTGPRQIVRKKGGVVIDPFDTRLKGKDADGDFDFTGYVSTLLNTAGQRVHFSIFEEFEIVGNIAIREFDQHEANRFSRCLLSSGMVPPVHAGIIKQELRKQDERIKRKIQRVGDNPGNRAVASELEVLQATRHGMENQIPLTEALDVIRGNAPEVDSAPKGKGK
jgi:hypothetical protein